MWNNLSDRREFHVAGFSFPPPALSERSHGGLARQRADMIYLQAAKIASTIGKTLLHVGTVRVVANS
jgi:hypothetical protein